MKSLSKRGRQRRICGSFSISAASPVCDKRLNASRKLFTEFIDVGRQVIILGSCVGNGAFETLQFLQGFGQAGESPRGALGVLRPLRLALELSAQVFDGGQF